MSSAAFRTCGGFTLLSALVSAAFSILAVQNAHADAIALYAASRSLALLAASIYALAGVSRGGVSILAVVMTVVQAFDGIIGLRLHEPAKAYGPFTFAMIIAGLLIWLRGKSLHTSSVTE